MKKLLPIVVFVLGLGLTTGLNAQKIGYINSQLLLSELPDYKNAQANFEAYATQLQKKLQQKEQDLQTDVQEYSQKVQQGELSPVQQQQEEARLQNEQSNLMKYQQELQGDLAKKEQEEMQPILDKVNDAIQAVATEGSYTYILDTSSGIILYKDDSMDVTDLVKAKLGL